MFTHAGTPWWTRGRPSFSGWSLWADVCSCLPPRGSCASACSLPFHSSVSSRSRSSQRWWHQSCFWAFSLLLRNFPCLVSRSEPVHRCGLSQLARDPFSPTSGGQAVLASLPYRQLRVRRVAHLQFSCASLAHTRTSPVLHLRPASWTATYW